MPNRRTRLNNNGKAKTNTVSVNTPSVVSTPTTAKVRQRKRPRRQFPKAMAPFERRAKKSELMVEKSILSMLTPAGVGFLKCAFAVPDFTTTGFKGIPDDFSGRTVGKMDSTIFTLDVPIGDTFILIAPTPGVAYWSLSLAAGVLPGGSTWVPKYFADQNAMFPAGAEDRNFAQFRYASLSGEIICTSSIVNAVGGITTQRVPIRLESYADPVGGGTAYIASSLDSIGRYAGEYGFHPIINGAYSVATRIEQNFSFSQVMQGFARLPQSGVTTSFGLLDGTVPGIGSVNSICFKISTPTGVSVAIRSWHCVEYVAQPGSAYTTFGGASPPIDRLALQAYSQLCLSIPISVDYKDNANFWEFVRNLLKTTFRGASMIPNPYAQAIGLLGGGVMDLLA